ncbi:superoxide dismutase family protein [Streptomyces sp. NBC_00201]|uniref:superoxide dismutase family protein n=1 Tax=unclassified Streptomyces TaxID=2593676 RepID=UPI0022589105|nr:MULTISPECIES: superoxide dismutase family protein [unclassified Streptomyces]MCX5250620.1 superoxide dismutase family protein [Streptomyces sp. NBC_00201]MCX5291451.1 superoxide dismutase family protein [Streptomyces sp. NBC_00183]
MHDVTSVHPSETDRPSPPQPACRTSRLVLGTLLTTALTVLLTGCGGDSAGHASAHSGASASSSAHGMQGMSDKAMGDPSATPAYKLPGAKVVKGTFKMLDTRPPGMNEVKGTAWLAQGAKGTTVTVSLTGLKAGHVYMAHLHAQHCSADNGGGHFQFDKGGPTMPPNEIHLMFTADKSGMGMTTVTNSRKTGKDAVAIVVHPNEAQDNRIACADFDF